jgi:hypothetical protein
MAAVVGSSFMGGGQHATRCSTQSINSSVHRPLSGRSQLLSKSDSSTGDRHRKVIRFSAHAPRVENSDIIAELHPARRPMRKVSSVYGGNPTFFGQVVRPRCSDNSCGNRSASVCRGIGNEAILALPSSCRASKWLLHSDANPGIRARASREPLIGQFSGSRCDRIFLNAAVWSEDVQRPARRGNNRLILLSSLQVPGAADRPRRRRIPMTGIVLTGFELATMSGQRKTASADALRSSGHRGQASPPRDQQALQAGPREAQECNS